MDEDYFTAKEKRDALLWKKNKMLEDLLIAHNNLSKSQNPPATNSALHQQIHPSPSHNRRNTESDSALSDIPWSDGSIRRRISLPSAGIETSPEAPDGSERQPDNRVNKLSELLNQQQDNSAKMHAMHENLQLKREEMQAGGANRSQTPPNSGGLWVQSNGSILDQLLDKQQDYSVQMNTMHQNLQMKKQQHQQEMEDGSNFRRKISSSAQQPIVNTNHSTTDDPVLSDLAHRYHIKKMSGGTPYYYHIMLEYQTGLVFGGCQVHNISHADYQRLCNNLGGDNKKYPKCVINKSPIHEIILELGKLGFKVVSSYMNQEKQIHVFTLVKKMYG